MRLHGSWLVVAMCLSACGVGAVESADDVDTSSDELSIDFTYACQGYGSSQGQALGLHLLHGKAYVSGDGFLATGHHDTHYAPPAGSTDHRYKSFTGWTDAPTGTNILVSKSLRQGGKALHTGGIGGFMDVHWGSRSTAPVDTFICRVPGSDVDGGSGSGTGALTPQRPIDYVLVWINDYQAANQHVTRVNLNEDGSYDATVDGHAEHGVYVGPSNSVDSSGACYWPIPLTLTSQAGAQWSAKLGNYDGSVVVHRDGQDLTLKATLPIDGEDTCDTGGGSYHDDDPVGCQYCTCDTGTYIPARGGCVP